MNEQVKIVLDEILSEINHQFNAIGGKTYYLYVREDDSSFISMIEPECWDMKEVGLTFVSEVIYTQNNDWEIK